MKTFIKKCIYTICKLPITFYTLKIDHVLFRCLKPLLYLSKNNVSVFKINSKKLKLYAFIPFISYVHVEIGSFFIIEII